tara:strand:- start:6352 stop:7530 length:1179 start_codon:yes stop_codon:yes gene_type:complete
MDSKKNINLQIKETRDDETSEETDIEKGEIDSKLILSSIILIQSFIRRYLANKRAENIRVENTIKLIIKIQSVVRMFLVKKKISKLLEEKNLESHNIEILDKKNQLSESDEEDEKQNTKMYKENLVELKKIMNENVKNTLKNLDSDIYSSCSDNQYLISDRDTYSKIFEDLFNDAKAAIIELDDYYRKLEKYNSLIQTSVILFSSASTFLQSILKDKYTDFIDIFTLSVSTYSSLLLSLSKFFKLDEKREKSMNLSEKYIELQSKINHQYDRLSFWKKSSKFKYLGENYIDEWNDFKTDLETSHKEILEIRKNLLIEYNKLIPNKNKSQKSDILRIKKKKENNMIERNRLLIEHEYVRNQLLQHAIEQKKHVVGIMDRTHDEQSKNRLFKFF